MREMFHRFAQRASNIMGSPWAFAVAVMSIIVWVITGPAFAFSDSWQLIINTSTTIVTFLMVFLIQNTQNREAKSTQLKLDELIRALPQARTALVDLEDFSEAELDELQQEFQRILKRIKGSHNRPG
jgi:low affinity Fe/Cu permease